MSVLRSAVRRAALAGLKRHGYRLTSVRNPEFLETLLYSILKRHGHASVLQIGANDGRRFDPIHEFLVANAAHVRAVVVEPLPDIFERLKATYARCPQVTPVNVAVHNSESVMTMYRVDPRREHEFPDWSYGIGSFGEHHHRLSGIPRDAMVSTCVPCMTLSALVAAHRLEGLDLLQMDTEGYDAELVLGIDFRNVRPRILRFEHGLPSGVMTQQQLEEVLSLLHREGYETLVERRDVTAYERYFFVEGFGASPKPRA